MYGGHRIGDNLFSQSLVAVNAETGERVWHYQTVHHGLWDYDPPAAPILMDINVEGREIKAVAQLTKQAFVFVFDRETGEPVWDIEERPYPSPTYPERSQRQPNLFPPSLRRSTCRALPRESSRLYTGASRTGAGHRESLRHRALFTPPSIASENGTQGTIQLPGRRAGQTFRERLSTLRPVCSIFLPSPPPSSRSAAG